MFVGSMISAFEGHLQVTSCKLVQISTEEVQNFLKSFSLWRVYNIDARKFVFMGTGPVACCPKQRNAGNSGVRNAGTDNISGQYEHEVGSMLQEMKSELHNMSYSFFNSSRAGTEYIENPDAYGSQKIFSNYVVIRK